MIMRKIVKQFGSSPRVWGQCSWQHYFFTAYRFIPTCVGTVSFQSACTASVQVHPHVCGDSFRKRWAQCGLLGSSPRVWGQCSTAGYSMAASRFIPTCVGTVIFGPGLHGRCQVHPHVCGDSSPGIFPLFLILGSSPRVWGQCSRNDRHRKRSRFIPTCVGTVV